jgi:hypothetical protein
VVIAQPHEQGVIGDEFNDVWNEHANAEPRVTWSAAG